MVVVVVRVKAGTHGIAIPRPAISTIWCSQASKSAFFHGTHVLRPKEFKPWGKQGPRLQNSSLDQVIPLPLAVSLLLLLIFSNELVNLN